MPVGTQAKLLRVLETTNCGGSAARSKRRWTYAISGPNKLPDDAVASGGCARILYRSTCSIFICRRCEMHKEDFRELVKSLLAT